MKNKAGLVALGVLAVAALTMYFGVLPNINTPKEDVPAATDTKLNAVGTTTEGDAKPAGDTVTAGGKSGRTPETAGDAAKTEAETTGTQTTETQKTDAKPDDAAKTEVASVDPKSADPTADWTVPAFDVLRVEPDGSTVIAGRAQPNTKLEVVNGDQVLATVDVGPAGDFAAVFDKPLAAGDYQLTLKSVGEGGLNKLSEEVATVSVPKDASGELLAMVSKPGEASRVITTPDTGKAADAAATAGQPAADGKVAADASTTAETAKTETAPTETATATRETPKLDTKPADAGTTVPAASAEVRVSAVEIEGEKVFVAGAAKPGALVRIYADDKLVGEMKADEEGRFVIDGTMPLSVGNHIIRADMLSADGSKVDFRAAVPFDRPEGNQVAVVADAASETATEGAALSLLGGGIFDKQRTEASKALALLKALFEGGKVPTAEELAAARSATEIALGSLAEFKLPDGVDAAGADMAAKASKGAAEALALLKGLPKDAASVGAALGKVETAVNAALTPQGGGVAADVAQDVAKDIAKDIEGGVATAAANDAAAFDMLRAGATGALDRLKILSAAEKAPAAADLAAARTSAEAALAALSNFKPVAAADAASAEIAAKAAKGASDALALLKAAPADASAVKAALTKVDAAVSTALAPKTGDASPGDTTPGDATPSDSADATANTDVAQGTVVPESEQTPEGTGDVQAETSTEPKTVEQAPLKQSKTSVIIRRGDTLWQISRRVYGAGVRYTTIYLANEDQISNPDKILPGQVFGVPDSALPDSEELHRKRLKSE
ncbi:LysM peptidoglycan-binding domain-containing protein [Pararhizobium sp.]|uniref:LysM peptidoglycan-binding domain-containing protein n=1 Tax=Pararhizobium sp. TaxID=1977563 RepID=UPI0027293794|nr:LysM peptidoglycan-binding domain-containing protein [Pararhizobium sp.]MDO9417537.1 LysM peptidoglycan-binding domain-containing protein [Pararhizobium sp.]